jgi:hypothetical protein
MILQINHLQKSPAANAARDVIDALLTLLEAGHLETGQLARLRVQLDWIQYRNNFREPVMAVPCGNSHGEVTPTLDLHLNTRQLGQESLQAEILAAITNCRHHHTADLNRVPLEEFCSFRSSIAWEFNRLYWHRLADWERATGRGYERALPGGQSDAHHPEAIAHGVADFWTLLKDMEQHQQLSNEIFILEIGVGLGKRAALWLDRFQVLDQQRSTSYYPRLKFLLGDYSQETLERSRPALQKHSEVCSFVVLDALNPIRSLSFLRHKLLHIHLTNVYDNLPDEELARRDGKLHLVQVRAYLPRAEAARICKGAQIPLEDLERSVKRLLEIGPDLFSSREQGVAFWQEVWNALRLEERLVRFEELPAETLPEGMNVAYMEEILRDAPSDVRFHLSTGAIESLRNTLPLLRPRGYLQVQDIFVTDLNDYRTGFYGPGKVDGSIVNWVNGALLRETAERAGYDLHFAPFHYRPGSHTSVLYTTQRE